MECSEMNAFDQVVESPPLVDNTVGDTTTETPPADGDTTDDTTEPPPADDGTTDDTTTEPPPGDTACTPKVDSVSPLTVTINEPITFTVRGSCLLDTTAFWIGECEDMTVLNRNAEEQLFECTPSWTIGTKQGVVKDKPAGTVLKDFNVVVQDCTPSVSSVSPLTAQLNQSTVFTVQGNCLPNTTAFWIGECENVIPLSGSLEQRQFQCTPQWTTGMKAGVVKDRSDGTELLNFTVTVQ